MLASIVSKLGVPLILFIFGALVGAYFSYQYTDKNTLIKALDIQNQSLVMENNNLIKINNGLKFNLTNNNNSLSRLEIQLTTAKTNMEILNDKFKNSESSIRKYVRINQQLVRHLAEVEQSSNRVSGISNASRSANEESISANFVDPVKFTNAVAKNIHQCNMYILQLNELIDWNLNNLKYYNGAK